MPKLFTLSLVVLLAQPIFVSAQVTLIASPYSQDFNSLAAGLPTGWSVRTAASGSALGTEATLVTANTSWSSSTGNFRNLASATGLTSATTVAEQSNAIDRALGVRQIAATDPSCAFVLQLANTNGLSNFSMTFKLQSLDANSGRTVAWQVDYGIGAMPSAFTSAPTDPSLITTGASTWATTNVNVDFGTALDNIDNTVWIRVVALSPSSGSGSRPTSAIDDVQLNFATGDVTPPLFTPTYPRSRNWSSSGFDLITNLNESGTTYFAVVANNAAAPTSMQIKSGSDANSTPLASNLFGSINVATSNAEYAYAVSELSDNTNYDVYVVAEDVALNLQASPTKIDVKTNFAGDVSPPTFSTSYPLIDSFLPTAFTIRTSVNEQGKIYYTVLPSNAAAPSSAQVKLGKDGSGATVATARAGTIDITSESTEFVATIRGLTPSTPYDVYVVAEDNVPNLQTAPTKISVVTGSQFLEDFNACVGTSSFTQYSVSGEQSWSCTDFGRGSSKGIRMNGFASGAQINEDWLISPLLSLATDAALSFYSQFSFGGPTLQLKISSDYVGNGNPALATWTDLNANFPTSSVPSSSSSLTDWTLSNVDLSAYHDQNVFIAFVYTSTTGTNTAARWSVDDIEIENGVARFFQPSTSALLFTAANTTKEYVLGSINIINDITITASDNFQLSKDNNTFSPSIVFTASEASAQPSIYVRFTLATPSVNSFTGSITHSSSGVASRNVILSATDKSQTFDVATWNIEWFGISADQSGDGVGPGSSTRPRTADQVSLQRANVAHVIKTIDADLYAFQEVGNENGNFDKLVADLGDGWAGIRSLTPLVPSASYGTDGDKVQRLAIVYKTSIVNPISTRSLLSTVNTTTLSAYPSTSDRFWASGRFPFLMTANISLGGVTKQIDFIDIHARANGGSTAADQKNRYDMRRYDVEYLKDSLDARFTNRNFILLGDFNDDVKRTVVASAATTESSYKKYVDDNNNYKVLTLPLSQANATTFVGSTLSMLDHIIISNELETDYVVSTTSIEDARTYVANYVNTTSDHLPVTSRFMLTKASQVISFDRIEAKVFGDSDFNIEGTSSSGLPLTFTLSDPKFASIRGNTISILKAGVVNITASQAGDENYSAATDVVQQLVINKANQTITFPVIDTKQIGDAPFTLAASSTSSLPISFTSTSGDKIILAGPQATIVAPGRAIIVASQPSDTNFNAADASQSFCILPTKPSVTVSFASGVANLATSVAGSYQWFLNGLRLPDANNQTHTATLAGTYKVQVAIDDCLSDFSADVPVAITGDIYSSNSSISLYPNPASNYLFISGLASTTHQCTLVDALGICVEMMFEKIGDDHRLTTDHLANGVYLIRIKQNNTLTHLRFVKRD